MTILPPSGPRTARGTDTSDVRDLLGAYALDALDDVERARVDRYLQTDLEAADEVASFRETASRLAVAAATVPPPSLRTQVLEEIRQTRQVPPSSLRSRRTAATGASTGRSTRWLAAACGVLLVGCVGLGAVAVSQSGPDEVSVVAGGAFAEGTAQLVQVDDRYVVLGEGVSDLPADRVYQLWSIQGDGAPVPEGFLDRDADGGYVGEVEDWQDGAVLAITAEPQGGSEAPTSDILATVET